jgi:hypothetical protein
LSLSFAFHHSLTTFEDTWKQKKTKTNKNRMTEQAQMEVVIDAPFYLVQPDDNNSIKALPSMTNDELYDHLGHAGVFSESKRMLLTCFDVFVHHEGRLYYRMKLKKDRIPLVAEGAEGGAEGRVGGLFEGTVFHDPMEVFIRRSETKDGIAVSDYYVSFDL